MSKGQTKLIIGDKVGAQSLTGSMHIIDYINVKYELTEKVEQHSIRLGCRSTIAHRVREGSEKESNCEGKVAKEQKYSAIYEGQLPMAPLNASKEGGSGMNLQVTRPHMSLMGSDVSGSASKSKSKEKGEMGAYCGGRLKKVSSKRSTLGVAECPLRARRRSGASHSNTKWNNRSVEEDPNLARLMAEHRRKYNLSCGDAIDHRPLSKSKGRESKAEPKGEQKGEPKRRKKTVKVDSKKAIKKTVTENDGRKYQPLNWASKSKGNTSAISINPNTTKHKRREKENRDAKEGKDKAQKGRKGNRQKRSKSKSRSQSKQRQRHCRSNKMFVLSKGDSDEERQ
jgi:hypothetical protein